MSETTTATSQDQKALGCTSLIWRLVVVALVLFGCIAALIVVAALLGIGGINTVLSDLLAPQEPVVLNSNTVLTLVQREAVLRTARYNFEKVVPVEFAQQIGGISGEKLLYIGVGYVGAGVDLGGLDEDTIAVEGKQVTLTLPPAHLTDCVLDAQRSYIYQHDVGALNFLYEALYGEPDLLEIAEQNAIIAFKDSALEGGILEQAREDAERQLRAILIAAGFESVEFTADPEATPQHDPACMPETPE